MTSNVLVGVAKEVDTALDGCTPSASTAGGPRSALVELVRVTSPFVERVLETVAAGQHHVLLIGSHVVTSLLTAQIIASLPPPTAEEERYIAENYAAAGLQVDSNVRPVRAPDPSFAMSRFVSCASAPRLGEFGLSAHGVLVLRDLANFDPVVLERIGAGLLLETPSLTDSHKDRFGLRPMPLAVAAMEPCPCGNWGDPHAPCRCEATAVANYHRQVPPTARAAFDVVLAPHFDDSEPAVAWSVEERRDRVASGWRFRESLAGKVDTFDRLTIEATKCAESFGQSSLRDHGAGSRLLRVAATMANLNGSAMITDTDILAATCMVLPGRTLREV